MTTTKKKSAFIGFIAVLVICALMLNPVSAYAWDSSTQGNSESENSNSVSGQSSGETSVQGWIGTFDGEENPDRPNPPEEAWINVKIPTTALFGSLASDEGAIYSPSYSLYNYSVRGVEITPTQFNVVSEPGELSGMTLNLNFVQPQSLSILLRSASDEFLGGGLSATSSIILGSGSEQSPAVASFNMSGQLPGGFVYPESSPYQPSYGLVFTFEAQAPVS